jgi:hypothetical protein
MSVEELKPVANDCLQRWTVSKRVNSSKTDKDDASLIEPIKLAAQFLPGHRRLSAKDCRSNRALKPLVWRDKRKRRQAASVHYCVVPQPRSDPRVYLAAS